MSLKITMEWPPLVASRPGSGRGPQLPGGGRGGQALSGRGGGQAPRRQRVPARRLGRGTPRGPRGPVPAEEALGDHQAQPVAGLRGPEHGPLWLHLEAPPPRLHSRGDSGFSLLCLCNSCGQEPQEPWDRGSCRTCVRSGSRAPTARSREKAEKREVRGEAHASPHLAPGPLTP